jgi:hypothetical protein
MSVHYYNYDMAPIHHEGLTVSPPDDHIRDKMVAIMVLKPYFAWTSRGNDFSSSGEDPDSLFNDRMVDHYRYGIHIKISAGGVASEFDWAVVVSGLLDAVVLFSLGNTIVNFLGRVGPLCPGVNKLYNEFFVERQSAPQAYARFVLQALTARVVFEKLDYENTNKLSVHELYTSIEEVLLHSELYDQRGKNNKEGKDKKKSWWPAGNQTAPTQAEGAGSAGTPKVEKTGSLQERVMDAVLSVQAGVIYTQRNLVQKLTGVFPDRTLSKKDALCLTDGVVRVAQFIQEGKISQIAMDDLARKYPMQNTQIYEAKKDKKDGETSNGLPPRVGGVPEPRAAVAGEGKRRDRAGLLIPRPDYGPTDLSLMDFINIFATPPCTIEHISTFTTLQFNSGWGMETEESSQCLGSHRVYKALPNALKTTRVEIANEVVDVADKQNIPAIHKEHPGTPGKDDVSDKGTNEEDDVPKDAWPAQNV